MKKIITFILVVAVVVSGIIFIPKVIHSCDDCDKFFVGSGYEPNIITDIMSEKKQIICKECAEKQHAIPISLGKSVEDFKYDLFE